MTKMSGPVQYWTFWGQKVAAPSAEMSKLRAAMMEKVLTWQEKRQIPGLTLGFAQQRSALLVAGDSSIQERVRACGTRDQHGNRSECGVVFCPRCLMLRRKEQTAENYRLFAGQDNSHLVLMTVLVRVISDLNDARPLQDKFELKARNAIMARRKKDPRWDNVMIKGYWEFDHLWGSDELGRNAKIALPLLGLPTFTFDESHWLLHFHAIVALGDISIDEFKAAMRRKNAAHPYQVDVQPFKTERDVKWNIRRITRYSMKFRIEDDYKRAGPFDPNYVFDMDTSNQRKWWPKEAVRLLVTHLSQPLHGYRSLQFWIGPKGTTKSKIGADKTQKASSNKGKMASALVPTEGKSKGTVGDILDKYRKLSGDR